jgi:hypothetical protein
MLDEVIPDIQTLVSASRQVSGGAERTALTNVLLHYPHSELVVSTEGLLLQESRQVGGIFFLMNDTAPNLSLLRDLESRLDSAFRRSPEWERFRERYLSGSSDRFPLLAPDPPSRPQ